MFDFGTFDSATFDLSPTAPIDVNAGSTITTSATVQFPINCILMGQQLYDKTVKTIEWFGGKTSTKTTLSATPKRRLSGASPSFTTTTNSKGYD